MKPIFFVLCLFISGQVLAQGFSAGLRGGLNRWSNTTGAELGKPNNGVQFTKSLYSRYESRRSFAAEFEISHYTPDFSNWQLAGECGTIPYIPYEIIEERFKNDTYEYTLGLQARTSRAGNKLKNYVGALISLHHHYTLHSLRTKSLMTNEVSKRSSIMNMPQTMFGINHYLSYNLSRHFNVHSQLALKLDIINMVDRSIAYPDNQLTWTIGCGYTF